ncbi:MAG: GspE/PulE family protein [bacterium]|nr:GspE/PulE family protein [bacterium]
MNEEHRALSGEIEITDQLLSEVSGQVVSAKDLGPMLEGALGKDTTHAVSVLLASALALKASDVHVEPEEKQVQIRLRVDGMLHDAATLSLESFRPMLSRIKLLSGLKLNVADRPQDGRFSINEATSPIEVRISSLPSEHGESLVMRVLDPKSLRKLPELGLRKDLLALFESEIKRPNGMVLVTGPTGSGKTTTLYAFLRTILAPEIKIITIEDPIEYHLEGISQTQVNPTKGYDFASGLKAIVRQDPDVILVGEMRDEETVDIALQAALTGHLVFSTLHTNDAAGAISRLISLGATAANIAPALNLVIAQRLVRTLCTSCGEPGKITAQELTLIERDLSSLPKEIAQKVSATTTLKRPKGCKVCGDTGYKGRQGIFEAIAVTQEVQELILASGSIPAVRKKAIEQGMVTMRQDGFLKALEGITTLEEVVRVAG